MLSSKERRDAKSRQKRKQTRHEIEKFEGGGGGGAGELIFASSSTAPPPTTNKNSKDSKDSDFDPKKEYDKLLDAISPSSSNSSSNKHAAGAMNGVDAVDPYTYLMSRERRVLDTIDRITQDRAAQVEKERTIFGGSLATHAAQAIGVVRHVLDDATSVKSVKDVVDLLHKSFVKDDQRRLYLGVIFIIIALIILAMSN